LHTADGPAYFPEHSKQIVCARHRCQGGNMNGDRRNLQKYSTQTLLASVQCASVLRDTSDLQQVVKHCVSILFPEHKDYLYAKLQQTSQNIPSASSISRSRLAVDVGMMLLARASNQQEEAKVTRTLLTDSSPQKKSDWCLTEIHSVQTCDLLRIIPLVRRLAGNRPE
ncbi:MAG: hypothetical protein ACKPKO_64360, partial [Candidatus Fonsibacter sp.]